MDVTKRNEKVFEDGIKKALISMQKKLVGKGINIAEKYVSEAVHAYDEEDANLTGNLLNSLCWGVAYSGELKASGFFRNAQSTKISYLHEWSTEYAAFPVDGHSLAAEYIERYGMKYLPKCG